MADDNISDKSGRATVSLSIRVSLGGDYALKRLSAKMGISKTAVIEVIARQAARSEGIEIPEELEGFEK